MSSNIKNRKGYFGEFGGCYLPEVLIAPIQQLQQKFSHYKKDKQFLSELNNIFNHYAGRPTSLTEVKNFSKAINGPTILLKREDLLHTGAHKINNALGQCLLAKKMHKKRIIAETGAGQHGVATAAACAYFNIECVVYMGAVDMARQAPNVERMRLLGAKVIAVTSGAQTLKDAVNEALRDWSGNFENTHYCLGSALGPYPYPEMVAFFQSVIGKEAKAQCLKLFNKIPELVVACVGGGSNAIGIFNEFIQDEQVKLVGVEAGGKSSKLGEHAARFRLAKKGVMHGCYTYLLQNEEGQVANTHSISAGLDYPAVGPQHAKLFASKRVEYTAVTDSEALNAFQLLSKTEGIIPALESSHAIAYVMKIAKQYSKEKIILINLSGRGDKDIPQLEMGMVGKL